MPRNVCKPGILPGWQRAFPGSEYTDEQTRFLVAMAALKGRLGRLPTPAEVLGEALRLGYRRTRKVSLRTALKALRRGE